MVSISSGRGLDTNCSSSNKTGGSSEWLSFATVDSNRLVLLVRGDEWLELSGRV